MNPLLAADTTTTTSDSGLINGVSDFFDSGTWLVIRNLAIFFVVVFWLASAYWVYKDARRRIADPWMVAMATVLGLIPPALVAWLVIDWQTAVIIAIGYSVLNVVVQTLIQPKVVGDRVQLNTTLTFLALIIWTFLLGGLGAILAIPMTLLIRALFIDSQPQHRWVRALFSSGPPPGTARRKKKSAPAIAHEPPAPDEAPSSVAP